MPNESKPLMTHDEWLEVNWRMTLESHGLQDEFVHEDELHILDAVCDAMIDARNKLASASARIAELEAAAREVLNELWETNDEFTEYQQALWEKVPLS